MRTITEICLFLSIVNFTIEHDMCLQNQTDLLEFESRSTNIHRKKRSLTFPKGSAFVVSLILLS